MLYSSRFAKYLVFFLAVLFVAQGLMPAAQINAATQSTFTQASWSGGATTTNAGDALNQNGWSYYSTSTASMAFASSSSQLQLGTTTVAVTQASSTDWNNGTYTSTQLKGTTNIVLQATAGFQQLIASSTDWTTTPAARRGAAAVWDGQNNRMLVFGGNGNAGQDFNDLWSTTGTVWTQLITTSTGASSFPNGRTYTAGAWDSQNNRFLIFGGLDATGAYYNDLWSTTGTVFTQLIASSSLSTWPAQRILSTGVWDPINNRFAVFGGEDSLSGFYNDLWSSTSTVWTQLIASTTAPTSPAKRIYQTGALDTTVNRLDIFGGNIGVSLTNDLWGIANGGPFNQLIASTTSPAAPTQRGLASAAFQTNGNLFIFGGYDSAAIKFYNDLWSTDGSVWNLIVASTTAASSPTGRRLASMVYDTNYGRFLIFGGEATSSGASVFMNDLWAYGTTYATSGTFLSNALDLSAKRNFISLQYGSSTPANTTLSLDVRAGNTATPDGTWTSWLTNVSSNGGSLSALNGNRYVQYRANFTTTDIWRTPSLGSVTINYAKYVTSSQSLTSSAYDTTTSSAAITSLNWNEDATLPASTTVTVSIKTASTSAALTSQSWTDFTNASSGCSKSAGTVTCGTSAIPAAMQSGTNDEWLQYKVAFSSADGYYTPTVSQVQAQYAWNFPPQFNPGYGTNGVAASQDATSSDSTWGKVLINYSVRDQDTATDTTPNAVTPSFAYNTGGGWQAISSSTLASGDLNNKTVSSTGYTTYTATWNAAAQTPGIYNSTAQVRVTANDNSSVFNISSSTGAAFILDTVAPTGTATFDAGAAGQAGSGKITITETDSTANPQYVASDDPAIASPTSTGWTTAAQTTTTIPWTFNSTYGAKTLNFQFRDAYGNTTATTTLTTAPPILQSSFLAQDTSNVSQSNWQEYISWQPTTSTIFSQYLIEYATSTDNSTYGAYATAGKVSASSTTYFIHTGLVNGWFYKYRMGIIDTNGNTSIRTLPLTTRPDGVQNYNEGGGGVVAQASVVQAVVPVENANRTVNTTYTLTDSSVNQKINPAYEAYLFYNIGVTLSGASPFNAAQSTLALSDASKLPASGFVKVSSEVLGYSGKSSNTLTGITRGTWPAEASSGRQTLQNSAFYNGTPVWIKAAASSTTPVLISASTSTISSGYNGTLAWNTQKETTLAGNTFSNPGIEVLVHDNQSSSSGPLSSQNSNSVDGTLATLDISNPAVQFGATSTAVAETVGTTTIPLTLSIAFPLDATVQYSIAASSTAAGGGTDYILNSTGTITIAAGQTSTTLSVSVVHNPLKQNNLTLILALSSPGNATLGANTNYTLTIQDVDSVPGVQFASASSSVLETALTAYIPVALTAISGQNITVGYSIDASSTAVGGSNYSLQNGTSTILAGQSSTTIPVTIFHNTLRQPNLTLVLDLGSPVNATLATTTSYVLTIQDVDSNPTVQFSSASSSVLETVGTTTIPITLSAISGQAVSVSYSVSASSTAQSGIDYILSNGTATVSAGQTSTTIPVTILYNPAKQPTLTLIINLSSPVNAILAAPTSTTLSIIDTDNATPQFDVSYGFGGVLVSQNSSSSDSSFGKVNISYSIRDTDTNTDTYNGYVVPFLEYNLGGGWQTIPSSTLASGDLNNKTVSTAAYTVYNATWNAKAQIPETYASAATVRITQDDGGTHNNTTSSVSAGFVLDTKNPATTFTTNVASGTINFTLTDDSNIQYRLSNNSDLSADGLNASSGQWTVLGATSTSQNINWNFSSSSFPAVTLNTRDAFGNTATTTRTAPSVPTGLAVRDTSNPTTGLFQNTFTWGGYTGTSSPFASYNVYRSTAGPASGFSLLTTLTPSTTIVYRDAGLSSSTTYYYKMTITDTSGDVSGWSAVVSATPNGQGGGTTVVPPAISGVASTTQSGQAIVTWTTNVLSTSEVDYSGPSSTLFSSAVSSSLYALNHSVAVTGLTPGTLYAFEVKSADVYGNTATDANGGSGYAFKTSSAPLITNVTVQAVTDKSAVVFWNTNKSSDSTVVYSVSPALTGSAQVNDPTQVAAASTNLYQHLMVVSGLQPGTTYYYYVKSKDAENLTGVDDNGGSYYSFRTTYDVKAPVISNVATPVVTAQTSVVVWNTDKPANSQVGWGGGSAASGTYANVTPLDPTLTLSHVVTISGLGPNTRYYFQVDSQDASGNLARSTESSFITPATNIVIVNSSAGGAAPPPPKDTTLPVISEVSSTAIGAFDATITFLTNRDTIGFASYGLTDRYGTVGADPVQSKKHSIHLGGLRVGTEYHYQVEAVDANGNAADTPDFKFTTRFITEALENAVTLENISGFQQNLENVIESTLPSLVPPFVGNVLIDNITENGATVSWKTNVPAYGAVSFASSENYDSKKNDPYTVVLSESDKKAKDHSVALVNLLPGTEYHLQAKAYVIAGAVGKSKDITFTTKFSLVKPEAARVGNTDADIRWTTDKETSSYAEYANPKTGKTERVGEDILAKLHSITISNLTPGTTYTVRSYGYDADHNLIAGSPITFRTKQRLTPPQISNIKIENALLPGRTDRLQSVVFWQTDEPANSIVYYKEGAGIGLYDKESDKTGTEKEYTQDHAVLITGFRPATVYRIKIVTTDESGNKAESPVRTILTPRASESVVDIVVKNLEESFGFLKKLQQ